MEMGCEGVAAIPISCVVDVERQLLAVSDVDDDCDCDDKGGGG